MNRLRLTLTLAAIAAALTVAPARAAFCGIPDDIGPVLKLTIATYPRISHSNRTIDQSYVKSISVNGTYAYSVTEIGSERIRFYWEKPTGTWHFAAANHPPSDFPQPLVAFFASDDSCNNPNFKKH